MTKLLLTLSAALALLATAGMLGASNAEGAPVAMAACKDGPTTVRGAGARRYCGPASAVVKVAGRTVRYRGGRCIRTAAALELNIGTAILAVKDPRGPLPTHFGVAVGRIFGVGKAAARDGSYTGATLVLVDRGKRFAGAGTKVTLSGGRTRGSFSGRLLDGRTVSGSFRCS